MEFARLDWERFGYDIKETTEMKWYSLCTSILWTRTNQNKYPATDIDMPQNTYVIVPILIKYIIWANKPAFIIGTDLV